MLLQSAVDSTGHGHDPPGAPRGSKPRGRHPVRALSTAFARSVSRPGRYCDGNGLYLEVKPTGTRSWVQRLVVRGHRRELGLGGFPLVSLRQARVLAAANRQVARAGGDPLADSRRARTMPTFAEAAERVWADKHAGWRHPRHARDWLASLQRYAFPRIGNMAVCDVSSADVLETLGRVWHLRPETARRLLQRISAVMSWSVAMQFRADNPCDHLATVLGRRRDRVQHMPALHHSRVSAAIRTIWASGATRAVKLAFEFLVLTATRSGEARGALWAEIDLPARVWTIPATRTKAKREHRVPLCPRGVQILHAARALDGGASALVFPSQHGNPISETRLSRLLKNHEIAAVPHGFRSSFRDWAAEATNHPRDVIEAALGHAVSNRTEAAYARSDLFERRRQLMDEWSAYLEDGRGDMLPPSR